MVEATGYDVIPTVFDRSMVDEWYMSGDEESIIINLVKDKDSTKGKAYRSTT